MVALTVLLLIAVITVGLLARGSLADQNRELAALQAQRQADLRQVSAAEQVDRPELDKAALSRRLEAIRAADKAVDTNSAKWRQGGSQLKIVWESVGTCMALVDGYNRTAGWFTAAELGGLPVTVDVKAAATDCGAATLAKNAKGAGF